MELLQKLPEWQALKDHRQAIKEIRLSDLFTQDAERGNAFFLNASGLMLDYSKNLATHETLDLLTTLAKKLDLKKKIDDLFSGAAVNTTENRPALHTALRQQKNVRPEIKNVLARMDKFVNAVHSKQWLGYSNKAITDVVNIGIGGSDLGPKLAIEALQSYSTEDLNFHFISSVHSDPLHNLLRRINPETTLFIVSSKSFTTQETLRNAEAIINWFKQSTRDSVDLNKHFIAITSNPDNAKRFGIHEENIFSFWNWVGGRYSLWSAIGLPVALAVGMENFHQMLMGAHTMDEHFRNADFLQNMPVLLGLLSIWYNNFFSANAHAISPYDASLRLLPNYLQQLVMESNGKSVDKFGNLIDYSTSPIIFGCTGTDGQHAFFQLLHQGTPFIPIDFIVSLQSHFPTADHQDILISQALSQSKVLMEGKSAAEITAEMKTQGYSTAEIERLTPHRELKGNKPSNTILIPKLTPHAFGSLIALYEHKTFTESVIWQINAFDQWGVEWGKHMAETILGDLKNPKQLSYDSSTNNLIKEYLKIKKASP